ncbi:hypothetical protein [Brevundimonas sp.]|uniref:baeRF11 domain-containing protein n=1 Tax=Brevundimonas sp. TaxID=1871086 RepID=UPI001DABCF91|nr:hypothetical protein [Brevundimonas sp.]MBA4000486.1 hypothetical protein [Brevundimonas sp.]
MLHIDLPTVSDISILAGERAEACVSIYLETTPLSQQTDAARITLGNLWRDAEAQLRDNGFDKKHLAAMAEHVDDLREDDGFWRLQANSLAVFVTPDGMRTFRLPNQLTSLVQVSDRFHLKPLLRAVTFPHAAFVLAVSENHVRLVEVFAEMAPQVVRVPGLPGGAADAVGKSSLNDRAPVGRIHGAEGQKVRFRQYLRQVDNALRPMLSGRETPLILAGAEPLASLFRGINTYPHLAQQGINASPDRMSEGELAQAARPILDQIHQSQVEAARDLYASRGQQGRATADLAQAARAATMGAVETLMVDIDDVVPGFIDEETGQIDLGDGDGARTYGVADEIARRALTTGARVLGVRKADLPKGAETLAATLRYPV